MGMSLTLDFYLSSFSCLVLHWEPSVWDVLQAGKLWTYFFSFHLLTSVLEILISFLIYYELHLVQSKVVGWGWGEIGWLVWLVRHKMVWAANLALCHREGRCLLFFPHPLLTFLWFSSNVDVYFCRWIHPALVGLGPAMLPCSLRNLASQMLSLEK